MNHFTECDAALTRVTFSVHESRAMEVYAFFACCEHDCSWSSASDSDHVDFAMLLTNNELLRLKLWAEQVKPGEPLSACQGECPMNCYVSDE